MAQVIVRPIADISKTTVGYSSGTNAYALINETTADGDSTYVTIGNSDAGGSLRVAFSSLDVSQIETINSITLVANVRSGGGSITFDMGLDSPISFRVSTSIASASYTERSTVRSVNLPSSSFNPSNMHATISTPAIPLKQVFCLTQMYIIIDYTEKKSVIHYVKTAGIWKASSSFKSKIGGVWKNHTDVYVKHGGVWKKQ